MVHLKSLNCLYEVCKKCFYTAFHELKSLIYKYLIKIQPYKSIKKYSKKKVLHSFKL